MKTFSRIKVLNNLAKRDQKYDTELYDSQESLQSFSLNESKQFKYSAGSN